MVGTFLAGATVNSHWFNQEKMDLLRHHVLLVIMPVFFLSTGLRTNWEMGGTTHQQRDLHRAIADGARRHLTVPVVSSKLARMKELIFRSK